MDSIIVKYTTIGFMVGYPDSLKVCFTVSAIFSVNGILPVVSSLTRLALKSGRACHVMLAAKHLRVD